MDTDYIDADLDHGQCYPAFTSNCIFSVDWFSSDAIGLGKGNDVLCLKKPFLDPNVQDNSCS